MFLCLFLKIFLICFVSNNIFQIFRLYAGQKPFMPIHDNWVDCYRHLHDIRGLKRGSSLIWRAYTGPTILAGSGPVIPTEDMFKSPVD